MSDQQQDEITRALDALLGKALDEVEPVHKTRRTRAKRAVTAPEDAFLEEPTEVIETPVKPVATPKAAPVRKAKPIMVTAVEEPEDEAPVLEPVAAPVHHKKKVTINADLSSLLEIKQQALTELSPLVEQLHQTPEEKFRTTMMLIQASDNAALIPEAYAAAEQIKDEKVRAQALLDVVNEINYFTQAATQND